MKIKITSKSEELSESYLESKGFNLKTYEIFDKDIHEDWEAYSCTETGAIFKGYIKKVSNFRVYKIIESIDNWEVIIKHPLQNSLINDLDDFVLCTINYVEELEDLYRILEQEEL